MVEHNSWKLFFIWSQSRRWTGWYHGGAEDSQGGPCAPLKKLEEK